MGYLGLIKKQLIELMVLEGHPAGLAEWEFHGMEQLFLPP